ncbi:hypothetical protein GMLC_22680 [Geomonas limicola]|uniref:Uncharacterized protein n=1 Tax=Geomonas limicola TaxID=2740186 RepID=A0A6V8NBU4_9BACT|nr:hypothetical protein GMLC_22680 [Geomonas limicola]
MMQTAHAGKKPTPLLTFPLRCALLGLAKKLEQRDEDRLVHSLLDCVYYLLTETLRMDAREERR